MCVLPKDNIFIFEFRSKHNNLIRLSRHWQAELMDFAVSVFLRIQNFFSLIACFDIISKYHLISCYGFFLVDLLTKCQQSMKAGRKSMTPSQERQYAHNNNDGSNVH